MMCCDMISTDDFKGYYKFKDNILLKDLSLLKKKIIRYTKLLNLLYCLSELRFYVSIRSKFNDQRESGSYLNFRNMLRFQRSDGKDKDHWRGVDNKIKDSRSLYVSCWSFTDQENSLLWRVFHSEIAILSTVEGFLRSCSESEDYDIVANTVRYECEHPIYSAEEAMFEKYLSYKDENEFRFYYIEKNAECECYYNLHNYTFLQMADCDFIDGIIISPFIDEPFKTMIKDLISEYKPDVKFILSSIIEKECR